MEVDADVGRVRGDVVRVDQDPVSREAVLRSLVDLAGDIGRAPGGRRSAPRHTCRTPSNAPHTLNLVGLGGQGRQRVVRRKARALRDVRGRAAGQSQTGEKDSVEDHRRTDTLHQAAGETKEWRGLAKPVATRYGAGGGERERWEIARRKEREIGGCDAIYTAGHQLITLVLLRPRGAAGEFSYRRPMSPRRASCLGRALDAPGGFSVDPWRPVASMARPSRQRLRVRP